MARAEARGAQASHGRQVRAQLGGVVLPPITERPLRLLQGIHEGVGSDDIEFDRHRTVLDVCAPHVLLGKLGQLRMQRRDGLQLQKVVTRRRAMKQALHHCVQVARAANICEPRVGGRSAERAASGA